MSRNSGNQPGGIFSTEYSNKIILLLLGVLILFVFLDFQARRRSDPSPNSAVASVQSSGEIGIPNSPDLALHPVLEPIRDKAEMVLGRAEERNRSLPAEDVGTPSRADRSSSEVYRNGPVLRPVESGGAGGMHLYFLRFKGNRLKNAHTELVRVKRPIPQGDGEFTLMGIIAELQKGPLATERGLLNAFDDSLKVTDVYADQGIAYVFVDKSIGRMGPHIIRDRLDQLTFTLTQFPNISGVKLIVDGSPVQTLGESGIQVPSILRPGDRPVLTFP